MNLWRELLIDLFGRPSPNPSPLPRGTVTPPNTRTNIMSLLDDAKAFVADVEHLVEEVETGIETAAEAAYTKGKAEVQEIYDAAVTDFNAAKAVYETTIADLKARIEAALTPAAPTPAPAPTAVPATPQPDPAPNAPPANMVGG